MPKASLPTEALRSKDDSDKENVHLLPDESVQKSEFVGDEPSNTIESLLKDPVHSCDHPLAERTQVVHSESPFTAFYMGDIYISRNVLIFQLHCFTFIVKSFRSIGKLQEQNNEQSGTLFLDSQINILPQFLFSLYLHVTFESNVQTSQPFTFKFYSMYIQRTENSFP